MSRKFCDKLNQLLDEIDMPEGNQDRIDAFAKLFGISKLKSAAILNGNAKPDKELLSKIADELEVEVEWFES